MHFLRMTALCACAILIATDVSAQQQIIINGPPDMPVQLPGMGPRQPKTGTGRLRGRVLSAETGGPVRRAQVRIASPDIGSKSAMTDAEGRYEFRDLPAGRFTISATKAGFVSIQYGQTRPFESGKPLDLSEGQVMDKADFSLPRGSAISGRLVDEFGDPIADAFVSAMRSAWSGGRRRLQSTGRTAQTNDLGQFRIYGLSPGDYYVSATFRGADMAGMEMAMSAMTGAGTGGPTGSTPNSGYAPTYFPGTQNGAEAQKISLTIGQEAQNTDFALLPVKLARISGTVISSDGKPVDGSIINAVPRNAEGVGMMMMSGSARSDKGGNFVISNLAPGEYTLQTRAMQFMTSSSGGDSMMFTARVGIGADGNEAESGSLPLVVSGEDLSGVVIVTSKGATASGHLVFEGGEKPSAVTNIRVSSSAVDVDSPTMMFPGGPGGVKADGTFELRGLIGTRIIRASNLPAGWMLKSVRVNGNDVTDTGLDFKPGENVSGLEVTLTSKLTEVNGTVKNGSQQVKDYTVVVFADEPQKWALPNSRYVAGTRPDLEGRFQIKNLPAGSYYAIAVDYLPQGEWGDPDILERLKPNATTFSVNEGQTKTLELTLR